MSTACSSLALLTTYYDFNQSWTATNVRYCLHQWRSAGALALVEVAEHIRLEFCAHEGVHADHTSRTRIQTQTSVHCSWWPTLSSGAARRCGKEAALNLGLAHADTDLVDGD